MSKIISLPVCIQRSPWESSFVAHCLSFCPAPSVLPCNSDINKIYNGIGDKLALLIQWLTAFVGGFIVGFTEEWRLTLVLIAFTPILAVAAGLMSKVREGMKIEVG